MADTKLPLTHWFRAMHLMTSTKQGISAIELGRRLGVSYPTAWYLHKRLRHAMTERGARHVLGAAVAYRAKGDHDKEIPVGAPSCQGFGIAKILKKR
jgi:DNA-binding CsgD family transcriptional regulator